MRYFYDGEFEERGYYIIPISLGIVSEDDRELYLINKEYMEACFSREPYYWKGRYESSPSKWLMDNVIEHISRDDVAEYGVEYESWGPIVQEFISDNGRYKHRSENELWAYYAAYDHVLLAQLWGPMINLPEPVPMYTHELKQIMHSRIEYKPEVEHNSLSDARCNRKVWQACQI